MHFLHCPFCGEKLEPREIGDEGLIPYCHSCERPFWDIFTTSVICAVVNEEDEIALLRQNYVSTTNYVCVAGIMKMGESAEETVIREVGEEIGVEISSLKYIRSYAYEKKEMLMLGFYATAKKKELVLSGEVDVAKWVPLAEAPGKLREGSIAFKLVNEVIRERGGMKN